MIAVTRSRAPARARLPARATRESSESCVVVQSISERAAVLRLPEHPRSSDERIARARLAPASAPARQPRTARTLCYNGNGPLHALVSGDQDEGDELRNA